MASTLIKGGYTLDPLLPFERRDVLIEGDRIAAVRSGVKVPADTIIDASDKIVAPGLVNAHAHASTALLRGLTDNMPLEPWLLFNMYAGMGAMSPRELYVSSAIGAVELLRTGTTCAVEHAHMGGAVQDFQARADAVVQGFLNASLRVVLAPMYSDLPFSRRVPLELAGEVSADVLAVLDPFPPADAGQIIHGLRGLHGELRGRDPLVSLCLGPANPGACSRGLLEQTAELARELGLNIHTHLLESKCMRVQQPSIVQELKELGWLGPHVSLAHGVWLDERDIVSLAETGAQVVHNPISNLKLGSGLAPVHALRARGVEVALGADNAGGASDSQNMFEVMKAAALVSKLRGSPGQWLGAGDAFRMCLQGGARVAGQPVGSLEPGSLADIMILDTRRLLGTSKEAIVNQLVYTDLGNSVHTVIVGGEVAVRDHKVVNLDEEGLYAEARDIGLRLQDEVSSLNRRLEPSLRQLDRMVAAARDRALPFTRLL